MSDASSTITVTLDKLAYGGEAMGRLPDGRVVFVPFGLPGECVQVRLMEQKGGFARGELTQVLEASPDRIPPKCAHFGTCGGCHYQNLPYEKQLSVKQEILRDQLARIGKIENPPVLEMVAALHPWNYRNHIQFHLTREGKPGYVNASGKEIMQVSECHLPEANIDSFWREIQFDPGVEVKRVSLRAGVDDELMLILESDSPEAPELEIEADISVVHLFEEHPVVLAGGDHLLMRILDRDFQVSAAAFFQVNTRMAERLVEHLLEELPVSKADTLLDLYCGVGLFSRFLAPGAGRVIGVEASAAACEDYSINLDEFDNVELYEGEAEEILPAFPSRDIQPTVCIVDPPRAGLDRRVLDSLLELMPGRLAYVSCDPSTLARDVKRLIAGGYRLKQVTPFDLFPQTYHIEAVAVFERAE